MDVCVVGLLYFECEIPAISEPLEMGVERFVDNIHLGLGGALNPASVLARLGADVGLVFPAGDGPSDAAARWGLARLPLRAFPFEARPDPAITVVQSGPDDRAFLSAADFDALERCPKLPGARWVHVPGLYEAQRLTSRLRAARAQGARVSVSGSWAPDAFAWLAALDDTPFDLLLLNAREATALAGDPERAPTALAGAARDVVVTLGPEGAVGRLCGEEVRTEAATPRAVVDSTGAGDAFAGGLLAALLKGRAPADALRLAAEVAARMLAVRGGVAFSAELFADGLCADDTTTDDSPPGLEETP